MKKNMIIIISVIVVLVLGIIMLAIFGFNLGLEFTGGTIVSVNDDGEHIIYFSLNNYTSDSSLS